MTDEPTDQTGGESYYLRPDSIEPDPEVTPLPRGFVPRLVPTQTCDTRAVIASSMDAALARYTSPGDDALWDVGYVMLPTPQGMQMQPFVVVSMRGPIIGGGPINATVMGVDLRSLRDKEMAERTVHQAVEMARQMASQMVAQEPNVVMQGNPGANGHR